MLNQEAKARFEKAAHISSIGPLGTPLIDAIEILIDASTDDLLRHFGEKLPGEIYTRGVTPEKAVAVVDEINKAAIVVDSRNKYSTKADDDLERTNKIS